MSDDCSSKSWSHRTRPLGQGVEDCCVRIGKTVTSQIADSQQRFDKLANRQSARRKVERIFDDIVKREDELKQLRRQHKANQRRLKKDRARAQKLEGQHHQHHHKPLQTKKKKSTFHDHEASLLSDPSRARGGGEELPPGWVHPNKGFSFTLFPPRSDHGTTTLRVPLASGHSDSGSDADEKEGDALDESTEEGARNEKGKKKASPRSPPPGKPRPRYRPGSRQVKHRLPPILSPEYRRN